MDGQERSEALRANRVSVGGELDGVALWRPLARQPREAKTAPDYRRTELAEEPISRAVHLEDQLRYQKALPFAANSNC